MAGGEGSRGLCTCPTSLAGEEAADAGAGGEEGEFRRKTKTKTSEKFVHPADLFAPLTEELANRKQTASAVETPPPPPGSKSKARMSERDIRWILSRKPLPMPRKYVVLKESNPDLTPAPGEEMDEEREDLYFWAKVHYCMDEGFPKLQEWVREELESKGFVEMDDDWVKQRAEAEEAYEKACEEIEQMIQELQFSHDDEIEFLRLDHDDSDYDDGDDW